ncbi:MAG TPA: hypothetical protein VJI33_00190 [Candidatus Paceibacterota bacterium]
MVESEKNKRVKYLEDVIAVRLSAVIVSIVILLLTFLTIVFRAFHVDLSFFEDIKYLQVIWYVNEIPMFAVSLFVLVWVIVLVSCFISFKKYMKELKSLINKSGIDTNL